MPAVRCNYVVGNVDGDGFNACNDIYVGLPYHAHYRVNIIMAVLHKFLRIMFIIINDL